MTGRRLEKDELHFGFWCKAGTTIDTAPRTGTLAFEQELYGIELPEDSTFYYDLDFGDLVVSVTHPTDVFGTTYAPSTTLIFEDTKGLPRRWSETLHWVVVVILLWPIYLLVRYLWRPEPLITVLPVESLSIDGIRIEPGDRIQYDEHGNFRSLVANSPREIADTQYPPSIIYWRSGGPSENSVPDRVRLGESHQIQGIPCAASHTKTGDLDFHPDGSLASCILSESVDVRGELFEAGTRLELSPDGDPTAVGRRERTSAVQEDE